MIRLNKVGLLASAVVALCAAASNAFETSSELYSRCQH